MDTVIPTTAPAVERLAEHIADFPGREAVWAIERIRVEIHHLDDPRTQQMIRDLIAAYDIAVKRPRGGAR